MDSHTLLQIAIFYFK